MPTRTAPHSRRQGKAQASSLSTELTEKDDGTILETRILTDRFVPTIRAWDLTEGSPTFGQVLTIR